MFILSVFVCGFVIGAIVGALALLFCAAAAMENKQQESVWNSWED